MVTYAGQVLGLIDSKTVQPRTFGMSDADFIAWVQKTQTFDVDGSPGQPAHKPFQLIPAEWNYYGGMESQQTSPLRWSASRPGRTPQKSALMQRR